MVLGMANLRDPYPENCPRKDLLSFTPAQVVVFFLGASEVSRKLVFGLKAVCRLIAELDLLPHCGGEAR